MALPSQPPPDLNAPPRLRRPDRQQLIEPRSWDDLVPQDHPVRALWDLVQRWDLTLFLQAIRARGERPGRSATDPQLLIALWLYATIEGIGRGRELARLCIESDPYKWLRGGVSLNDHTLNDFRVDHEEALDNLLTQMIAVWTQAPIVSVARIAQDGTRIRATPAATASGSEKLWRSTWQPPGASGGGQAGGRGSGPLGAAAGRAAAGGTGTPRAAGASDGGTEEGGTGQGPAEGQADEGSSGRALSTDPEARMMRMPDGGTRPAYTLELATDCSSRAIVGVEMTNAGSDAGQDAPMRDQVEARAEEAVEEQLIDGGFVSLEAIDHAAVEEVTVYAPVPTPRKAGVDRHVPKPTDSAAVAEWRQRMGTTAAQQLYKQRSSTIETINGELKTERGLGRLLVRGLRKVQCVALWSALASNVVHFGPILLSG